MVSVSRMLVVVCFMVIPAFIDCALVWAFTVDDRRFTHSVPFNGSVRTWHNQITHHIFLGLYCFWMYHHSGRMSPPQVVYVLGVVAPSFLNVTILHRRWLGFWGNCLYSGGYCSLINSIYLSIFQNLSTLGGASSETSWVRFYHRPLHRSCWAKHMSWMCILLS